MKRDDLIFEYQSKKSINVSSKVIELIASENFVSDQVMQAMAPASPTSMLKDTPASVTMVVVR